MTSTVYCGVDFHARVQTIAYCTSTDGEVHLCELDHRKDDVQGFYAQFSGEVVIGLEASGYSSWFERMLEELGHEVWLGHAAEIRRVANRRQKNDRRDAELILDLLVKGDFPRIHRPTAQSIEILRMLRYRHRLVKIRTMIKNNLQALAIGSGLTLRSRLLTRSGRSRLLAAQMSPSHSRQREEWLSLLDNLDARIASVVKWLEQQAKDDSKVQLLRTHPGLGLLTSLGLVHTLEPVSRFPNQRKVVAYLGMEPMERSSAEKKRYIGISKAGSRLVRFLLGEAAQTAARDDQELKRFYRRIVARRGKPKALVAVGRKLLIRGYIMLRDNVDYAEFLRRGVEARPARKTHRDVNA
jgi:transposase